MTKLNDFEKGYIAAFLDGEGTICITKSKNDDYRPQVVLYNTHKGVINYLSKLLKTYSVENIVDKRKGLINNMVYNRVSYQVSIRKLQDIYLFLTDIKTSLIIKEKQAENCLKFLEYKFNRLDHKYSEQDKKEMNKFYLKQKKLNKGE